MNKASRVLLGVIIIGGLAGWALLLRPYVMKGSGGTVSGVSLPAVGTVFAGNNVIVAAEPGYVTSWRVGIDGKLTRLDVQQTVPLELRTKNSEQAVLQAYKKMFGPNFVLPKPEWQVSPTPTPTFTPQAPPSPTEPEPSPSAKP